VQDKSNKTKQASNWVWFSVSGFRLHWQDKASK